MFSKQHVIMLICKYNIILSFLAIGLDNYIPQRWKHEQPARRTKTLQSNLLAFTSVIICGLSEHGFLSLVVSSRVLRSPNTRPIPPTRRRNIWLGGCTRRVSAAGASARRSLRHVTTDIPPVSCYKKWPFVALEWSSSSHPGEESPPLAEEPRAFSRSMWSNSEGLKVSRALAVFDVKNTTR